MLLVAMFHARAQVRSGRAFEGGLYRLAGVAVDVQVLLGAWIWYDARWWEAEEWLEAWLHPGVAVVTLVVVHVGLRRATNERWAAEAYAIAARTLMLCVLLVGAAIAAAVAAAS